MTEDNQKTILIVEDEADLRSIMADTLTKQNFKVLAARNGEEGLNTALQNHPDLILLDLLMPQMGGMAVLQKLRQDPWGKNVHVIILTNLPGSDDATIKGVSELLPAYYFLKNDMSLESLTDKIREVLKD